MKRLLAWQLVQSAGRTQSTSYFDVPGLLRALDFSTTTTLKRIEPHLLGALILKDVGRHPGAKRGELPPRIGVVEIPCSRVRRALDHLVKDGKLRQDGVRSEPYA